MQEEGTAGAGLPEPRVWKYFIQALLGLQYIHSRKIIHRDIKSLNLFLDHNDNVKVGSLDGLGPGWLAWVAGPGWLGLGGWAWLGGWPGGWLAGGPVR